MPATKPPILMISGHLLDARLFRAVAPRLSAVAELEALCPPAACDVNEMSEILIRRAPERFAVVGFGLGGVVAMAMMTHWPERVLGAALIAVSPHAADARETALREERLRAARRIGPCAYVDPFVADAFLHQPRVAARLGPELRAMALEAAGGRLEHEVQALARRPDRLSALRGFRGPVEVVVGAEDRVCPPSYAEALARAAPKGRFSRIVDVGHMALSEAPAAVGAALEFWVGRLQPGPRV